MLKNGPSLSISPETRYAWASHRKSMLARKTRQYLQLDSLAPDEYDVQRLDGEPGDF